MATTASCSNGAYVVYDQASAHPDDTARLVRWMASGHTDQLLLGTDGARRSLWSVIGGRRAWPPGHRLGRRLAGELGPAVMDRIWSPTRSRAWSSKP